ncbi:hypothetical protein C8R46DRAFT_1202473 [Mycena filopes]|nr:hypothetical protein C8R46DRAFT_1202473 [Mycena filopes]
MAWNRVCSRCGVPERLAALNAAEYVAWSVLKSPPPPAGAGKRGQGKTTWKKRDVACLNWDAAMLTSQTHTGPFSAKNLNLAQNSVRRVGDNSNMTAILRGLRASGAAHMSLSTHGRFLPVLARRHLKYDGRFSGTAGIAASVSEDPWPGAIHFELSANSTSTELTMDQSSTMTESHSVARFLPVAMPTASPANSAGPKFSAARFQFELTTKFAAGRQALLPSTRRDATRRRELGFEHTEAPRSGADIEYTPTTSASKVFRKFAAGRHNPPSTRKDAMNGSEHDLECAQAPRSGADVDYTTDRRPPSKKKSPPGGKPPFRLARMREAAANLGLSTRRRRGAAQHRLHDISPSAERLFSILAAGRRTSALTRTGCGGCREPDLSFLTLFLQKKARREANTRLYCSRTLPRLARDNFSALRGRRGGKRRRRRRCLDAAKQGCGKKTRREANPRLCHSTPLSRASRGKNFLPADFAFFLPAGLSTWP